MRSFTEFRPSSTSVPKYVVPRELLVHLSIGSPLVVAYFLNGRPRSCEDILATEASFGRWGRGAGRAYLSTPREESSRKDPLAAELGASAREDR